MAIGLTNPQRRTSSGKIDYSQTLFRQEPPVFVPPSYVREKARSLDDALQGGSSHRPKRLDHNGFGREPGRERQLRGVIQKMSAQRTSVSGEKLFIDVKIAGYTGSLGQPADGLSGFRRKGGMSWIRAFTWNAGSWPVMRSESPIRVAHDGGSNHAAERGGPSRTRPDAAVVAMEQRGGWTGQASRVTLGEDPTRLEIARRRPRHRGRVRASRKSREAYVPNL